MDRRNYGVQSKAVTTNGFNKTRTMAVRLSEAVGDPGGGNENGGGNGEIGFTHCRFQDFPRAVANGT